MAVIQSDQKNDAYSDPILHKTKDTFTLIRFTLTLCNLLTQIIYPRSLYSIGPPECWSNFASFFRKAYFKNV